MHFLIVQMKGQLCFQKPFFQVQEIFITPRTLPAEFLAESCRILCDVFSVRGEERAVKRAYLPFFLLEIKIVREQQLRAVSSQRAAARSEQQHFCKPGKGPRLFGPCCFCSYCQQLRLFLM